jgi:hypothetical protein
MTHARYKILRYRNTLPDQDRAMWISEHEGYILNFLVCSLQTLCCQADDKCGNIPLHKYSYFITGTNPTTHRHLQHISWTRIDLRGDDIHKNMSNSLQRKISSHLMQDIFAPWDQMSRPDSRTRSSDRYEIRENESYNHDLSPVVGTIHYIVSYFPLRFMVGSTHPAITPLVASLSNAPHAPILRYRQWNCWLLLWGTVIGLCATLLSLSHNHRTVRHIVVSLSHKYKTVRHTVVSLSQL